MAIQLFMIPLECLCIEPVRKYGLPPDQERTGLKLVHSFLLHILFELVFQILDLLLQVCLFVRLL